jgi:hypothetical protein
LVTTVAIARPALGNVEVYIFVDRHGLEAGAIERHVEDALLLRFREAAT